MRNVNNIMTINNIQISGITLAIEDLENLGTFSKQKQTERSRHVSSTFSIFYWRYVCHLPFCIALWWCFKMI